MTLWRRFVRWVKSCLQPKSVIVQAPVTNAFLRRMEALEASVADVVVGRKLERWANEVIAPELGKLEAKIKHLEEKMATHADLQPVIQGIGQHLEQFLAKQEQVLADLAQTRTALEAQTDKYTKACEERDAALEREQTALRERDEIKAELEKWDQMVVNAHSRAVGAVSKAA